MNARKLWSPVMFLIALAVMVAAGLGYLHQETHQRIEANARAWEMRQIRELLPDEEYDNNLFGDLKWVTSNDPDGELLGQGEKHYICRATREGQFRAAILQVTADRGYAGPIELMVAINADGSLAGVRATQHRETPGLGDLIDADKSDWVKQFDGRVFQQDQSDRWRVKKDGGDFDQITGATVTPRAIVSAVRDALVYFEKHRDSIMSDPQSSDIEPVE